MNKFVLDNSVAMRWVLATNKKSDQSYAEETLKSLESSDALVPNLWHLEAANVLCSAVKNAILSDSEVDQFLSKLEMLPVRVDPLTSSKAFSRTLALAKRYGLSSYNACYLELAVREGIPLATLDRDLIKAAKKAGVERYEL